MKLPLRFVSTGAAVGSTLLLAACGGGSGDMPVPVTSGSAVMATSTIDPANAKMLAAQAFVAADGLNSVANASAGPASALQTDALGIVARQTVPPGTTGATSSRTTSTININCRQGGTAVVTVNAASLRQLSTGDTIDVSASNCVDGSDSADGAVSVAFNNVTGKPSSSSPWAAILTLTFDNFTFNNGSSANTANGSLLFNLNQTAASTGTFSLTGDTLQLHSVRSDSTIDRTLTGFSTTGSVNANVFTYRTSFTLSGNFPTLGNGSFTVTTPTDFVQQKGSNPTQGVLNVVASDNSSVVLTAVDANTANLLIRRPGQPDQTVTTSWSELRTFI